MLPELDALLALQRQDSLLLEARRQKDRIPGRRDALQSSVNAAGSALDLAKKELEQARLSRRTTEKEVDAFTAEANKLERQLHDVKTNKEYQAMLHEIELVKNKRSDQETKILESYDREERLNGAVAAAERRLKDEEAKLSSEVEVLAREEATLEQRIHSIAQDRDAVKPRLPATLLSRYDRLLGARDGVAVAEVRKGACGACFKALTPHALQEVRRGDQVKICEACGRILIYSETAPS